MPDHPVTIVSYLLCPCDDCERDRREMAERLRQRIESASNDELARMPVAGNC